MKSHNSHHYMKTSDDWLSVWTKKKLQRTSQSQTCTKRSPSSMFGGLLPIWSTTAFSVLVKQLHLRSVLNKLMICSKNAMPAVDMSPQKEPNSSLRQCPTLGCTTIASKVERTELQSFASSSMFTRPLANQLPLLQVSWQLFAGKTFSQPAWCRKCFPRGMDLYAIGINELISHCQQCVDCNRSYFINKDIFESGKGQFSFQSQRKAMPKNGQTTAHLHSSHMLVKWCSKFSKPGFSNMRTVNFQMFKLVLEKAGEPEIKLPTSNGSLK